MPAEGEYDDSEEEDDNYEIKVEENGFDYLRI